jgi:hypothetical protein
MNGYNLIRDWYNYKFDNPSKVKAIHSDFYCYLIDRWNRLGQKKEFGLPTDVTMEALGIGSYNTYKKVLNDLIDFGFISIVKKSINQHQSKIIALSKNDKSTDKALDKATIKATDKALDETSDTIIKQINNETNKQINNIYSFDEFWDLYDKKNDRKKCSDKFNKLTGEQLKKIKEVLPIYIKSKPDVTFRKNPLTWLNGECWNDEIKNETISKKESNNNTYGFKIII